MSTAERPHRLPPVPSRIVLAPMAGGPGTPELAAAVNAAGGLGFLPSGYLSAPQLAEQLGALRSLTDRPVGVNLFVPAAPDPERLAAAQAYAARVRPWAQAADLPVGEPAYSDDDYPAKVELLLQESPALVSFTFGLPEPAVVAAFHERDVAVLVTVTTPEEAALAAETGADALVVQGAEAGAHQGGWRPVETEPLSLLPLLQRVMAETRLPVVAAGGIATRAGVAAVLALGAWAAMLGTAFLRCPEAGTAPVHRAALERRAPTVLTRAFTGRAARGLHNAFVEELGDAAPAAYPEVHVLTAPLRAEARRRSDPERTHLWAGQAYPLAREVPAGQLVAELAADAGRAGSPLGSTPPDR